MLSNSDTEDTRKIYSKDRRYFKNFMVNKLLHLKQKIVLKLRRLLLQIMSSKNQSKYPMLFSYDIPQADNV